MVDEQQLREKAMRLETLDSQLQVLEEQVTIIQEMINEHEEAKETIKKYREEEEDSEMLVPIGANSHLYCKVGRSDKVLIGLGADVSAETDFEDAVDIIDRRKDELSENKEQLEDNVDRMSEEYQKLEQEVRREYQEMQGQL